MSHGSRTIMLVAAVLGMALYISCGSDLPHSNQVTVTVTPSVATMQAGETLVLEGNATGFTRSPIVRWWISEAHSPGNDDCRYLSLPPVSPCPFGYIVFGSVTQFPSPATYYAPSVPGVYHVTFEATQIAEFDYLTKTAEATITVTP